MDYFEKTIYTTERFKGNVITMQTVGVELPNGKEATRDVIRHPGASVVVPVTEHREIYMVRQFRKPIDKTLLEVPAGRLNPGENPLDCAKRELHEETGLTAAEFTPMTSIYTAPGFTDEVIHIYMAKGLSEGEAHTDDDESISCEKIAIDELLKRIGNLEIVDAKSIIGITLADKILKGEIKR